MRTRRSPRNQETLWRALGGPKPPPPPKVSNADVARRALAEPLTSPRLKAWARRILSKEARP